MDAKKELIQLIASISDEAEMEGLLTELLSPAELRDIALRWQLLVELYQGQSQRSIAAKHGMSLCKITRGSKQLKKEDSVTGKLLEKLYKGENR